MDDTELENEEKPCPDCPQRPGKCGVCLGIRRIPFSFISVLCLNCDELGNCLTCKGEGTISTTS